MRAEEWMKAIDGIDDRFVAEAAAGQEQTKRLLWVKAIRIAAAFVVVTAVVFAAALLLLQNSPTVVSPQEDDSSTEAPLFSVRVYAADHTEKILSAENEESVQIMGSYNPLASSGQGLGIPFKITCPGKQLRLETTNGHFLTWEPEDGAVDDYGSVFTAENELKIFWTPYEEDVRFNKSSILTITVTDGEEQVVLADVKISSEDEGKTFSARMVDHQVNPEGTAEEESMPVQQPLRLKVITSDEKGAEQIVTLEPNKTYTIAREWENEGYYTQSSLRFQIDYPGQYFHTYYVSQEYAEEYTGFSYLDRDGTIVHNIYMKTKDEAGYKNAVDRWKAICYNPHEFYHLPKYSQVGFQITDRWDGGRTLLLAAVNVQIDEEKNYRITMTAYEVYDEKDNREYTEEELKDFLRSTRDNRVTKIIEMLKAQFPEVSEGSIREVCFGINEMMESYPDMTDEQIAEYYALDIKGGLYHKYWRQQLILTGQLDESSPHITSKQFHEMLAQYRKTKDAQEFAESVHAVQPCPDDVNWAMNSHSTATYWIDGDENNPVTFEFWSGDITHVILPANEQE